MEKCWWCGDIATTREHKIKRSVAERLAFRDAKGRVKFSQNIGGKIIKKVIQSSTSSLLKYNKNLCESCNTNKSSAFDKAYDTFFHYIEKNECFIRSSLKINMKIVGIDQEDLFRYFIKSFCCTIDSTKHINKLALSVPSELVSALNGRPYNKSLAIQFCTHKDLIKCPLNKAIYVTDAQYTPMSDGTYLFEYSEIFGWLVIHYVYQTVKQKSQFKEFFKISARHYWFGKSKTIVIDQY